MEYDEACVGDLVPDPGDSHLKSLSLNETHVTNIGPLEHLTSPETLDLSGTFVKDFSPLVSLSNLKLLDLRNTKVADDQLEQLQTALPDTEILR